MPQAVKCLLKSCVEAEAFGWRPRLTASVLFISSKKVYDGSKGSHPIKSIEDFQQLMLTSFQAKPAVADKGVHTIVRLTITSDNVDVLPHRLSGSLTFADLAPSCKTPIDELKKMMMVILHKCLSQNEPDRRLTRVLCETINEQSHIALIVHVSPCEKDEEQTLKDLEFADMLNKLKK